MKLYVNFLTHQVTSKANKRMNTEIRFSSTFLSLRYLLALAIALFIALRYQERLRESQEKRLNVKSESILRKNCFESINGRQIQEVLSAQLENFFIEL